MADIIAEAKAAKDAQKESPCPLANGGGQQPPKAPRVAGGFEGDDGPLRGRAAADAAAKLGYDRREKDPPFPSHGQPVYTDGTDYITPDADGHSQSGGWKWYNRWGQRIGTYTTDGHWVKE
jgi:filamentous hemagglutinin